MTGDTHAVIPTPPSAADPSSAAERLARATAVLAEAEASAAATAAVSTAGKAQEHAGGTAEGGRRVAVAGDSSALGLAWVDSPADVPAIPTFADLVAEAARDEARAGGEGGPRRRGRQGRSSAGERDGRRGRRSRDGDRRGRDREAEDAASESGTSEASGASAGPASRRSSGPELEPEAAARAIVLRQLTMAPRSRAQLERKLSERGCDDDVAARVLDRMTEVGLVDDEAYAQMLVRVRHSDKGLARRALSHELRRHGIDPELADVALLQVGDGDERVRAEQLVEKRLRSLHGLAPEVQSRRLAGLLARKGYSSEIAYPVIRDAVAGAQEHRRD